VKRYARRKPGMFILVAATAGILAGRLTRALAANAADDAKATTGGSTYGARPTTATPVVTGVGVGTGLGTAAGSSSGLAADEWAAPVTGTGSAGAIDDTPIYAQSATDVPDLEDGDDRSNSV
jgi:hypothetical protein